MIDIRRRDFIALVGGAAATWPLAARAQPMTPTKRVAFLGSGPDSPAMRRRLACFSDGLRRLGWTEGQNVNFEYRWLEGTAVNLPGLAADLIRSNPDLVIASGTPAAQALQRATGTVPIVFAMVSDPVASGLVASIARPIGNITGVSNFFPATTGKLSELLKTTVPGVTRVVVLHDPDNAGKVLEVRELRSAAPTLGVSIEPVEMRTSDDVERAFAAMSETPPHALIVLSDGVTQRYLQQLVEHAARNKLPAIYQDRAFVDAGGLMSYGLNVCRHFERAAHHVDKILRGAKPADVPVELPTTFDLVINLKSGKALGLDIPPTLIALADEVIE